MHRGVPMEAYLAAEGASRSRLWDMWPDFGSPAMSKWNRDHFKAGIWARNLGALDFGTAFHSLVLEPLEFAVRFACGPEETWTRSGKPTKAMQEWAEENEGKTPLSPVVWDKMNRMRDAIRAHPKARRLISGETEATAIWDDPVTGVRCRGRFDLISDLSPSIVDLKTAADVTPDAFYRAIYRRGYFLQGAMYLQAAQELGLSQTRNFIILAIEKEPPYWIRIYNLEDEELIAGADALSYLLHLWKRCEESGEWPDTGMKTQPGLMPHWAFDVVKRITGVE